MVEFDAGGKFGKILEGIKVPALREFCDLTNPNKDILLNVEIKEKTNEAVDIAIKILKEYDLVDI